MTGAMLLGDNEFSRILPFHLVWNADGGLDRVSSAVRRLWQLADGAIPEIRLVRPFSARLDPSWFVELTEMVLTVSCTSAPYRTLRGEIMSLADGRWILCAAPTMGRVLDLENSGLRLSDLPLHSGLGDALIAAEAAHISLQEALGAVADLEKVNASLVAMNEAFGRFVPRPFLESLGMTSPIDAKLGARASAETTVMFADLRNFTTISEQLETGEIFAFINRYLAHVAPRIRENEGFVVHYLGDGILALFNGAPERAVRAAIEMQVALKEAIAVGALGAGLPLGTEITLGIGLHFGRIEMGIVGESGRWDSSVISDAVNTASRVEGLTKTFGAEVLITGDLALRLAATSALHTRRLGRIEIKGRAQLIELYEVLDSLRPELREVRQANAPKLAAAITAFDAALLDAAAEGFRACLHTDPTDRAAQHYLARCTGDGAAYSKR